MSKQGKNIYHRKDGRWEGRYEKERINGKIQYGYVFAKTFEEAERKLDEVTAMNTQILTIPSLTFGKLSDEWLSSQIPQLKDSSISKYRNILKSYLVPKFGTQPVESIARGDVAAYSRELLVSGGVKSEGLAPKTINSIISVLKNVFEYGEREKAISVADIKDIAVKQPQTPLRILSHNEQHRLSMYLCDNLTPSHMGILLCLYTGLRIGEVCALKWKDIRLNEQYIHVHQTMQRIQTNGETGNKTEVKILPPKSNCSVRNIPIPDELLQLLRPLQKSEDAFLLTGMIRTFIEPRCMENHFKAVTEACCIQDVHFHTLRHTFATRCVELGFDIKSLSEILGHASVNITLNRYVHPSMELKQKNMNMLSGFLTTN